MPETYGQDEPELTPIQSFEKLAAGYIAGQGVVRRTVLYIAAFILVVTPFAPLAVIPLGLLIATDRNLA